MRILNRVYEDDAIVIVDKPAGLLVHQTKLAERVNETVVDILKRDLGKAVHLVHRLDRPTSGLLVLALDPKTAGVLARQFADRSVHKEYQAIVRGWFPDSVSLNYPLVTEFGRAKEQSARTDFICLARSEVNEPTGRYPTTRLSLVKAIPHTGRTHQIRRHLAHLRHPILGDSRHGDGHYNRFLKSRASDAQLMLRASRLSLNLPRCGTRREWNAPAHTYFDQIRQALDLSI